MKLKVKFVGEWKLRPGHKIYLAPIDYLSKGPKIH